MSTMSPLIVAALTTLGHAVFWFALAVFDLVVMAYGGEGALRELIPETVVRAKNGMHWAREHPKAFILDLVASAAFASFWLREFLTRSNPQPLWLVIAISLAIFGSSLVWWPLMISWVLRHPVITAAFMLAVLCSALSLYFFTVAEWIQISL